MPFLISDLLPLPVVPLHAMLLVNSPLVPDRQWSVIRTLLENQLVSLQLHSMYKRNFYRWTRARRKNPIQQIASFDCLVILSGRSNSNSWLRYTSDWLNGEDYMKQWNESIFIKWSYLIPTEYCMVHVACCKSLIYSCDEKRGSTD